MNCKECKQPINTDKNDFIRLDKPEPSVFATFPEAGEFIHPGYNFYHKTCLPTGDLAKEVQDMRYHNAVVHQFFSVAKRNDWTYRETLERMVIFLAQDNNYLHKAILGIPGQLERIKALRQRIMGEAKEEDSETYS